MKEENIKGEYQRKVDKSLIPTCNIMGVNIAAINMNWLLKYLDENLSDIKGDYICVSNVHTTVTSYENAAYCAVQNGGLMAIPDGGPLSSVGRKRGYSDMDRTTGPNGLPLIVSNTITQELKITDAVEYIGLDEKTSKWCEVIERYNGYKRKNTRMEITKAGFDIDDTVIRLERIYLSKKRVL